MKKNIGFILSFSIIALLALISVCFIVKKNKSVVFYANVKEVFNGSAIVETLDGSTIKGKINAFYLEDNNYKVGDIVKIECKLKDIEDTYPATISSFNILKVKAGEVTSTTSSTTTEETTTTSTSEVMTTNRTTTTSVVGDPKKTTTKTTTTSRTTTPTTTRSTTVRTTTSKKTTTNNDRIYDEDDFTSYVTSIETDVNNNASKPSFKETAKNYFISLVDFIFYGKDIKGVYFKDLTNKGKLFVVGVALRIDNVIEKYYPNYKQEIGSSYNNAKSDLIRLYLDKTSSYCANHDAVCEQAKSDFSDLKKSLNITWDIIKDLSNAGIAKLKEWYEIYSGK